MWLADNTSDNVIAFNRQTGVRGFSLGNVNLRSPFGIWSDGTTMWIADPDDDTLYSITIADNS